MYIIISFGLLIRLAAEFMQPAYTDEAFIYFTSRCGWKVFDILISDPHPPLWNIILYLPVRYLEYNIAILRLPSLIFSVLSIYASYRIGKIFQDDKTGLLLAAFSAVSCPVWQNDIQIRPIAALTWSALVLLIMMTEILESGKPKSGWLAFTATASLCASVHFLGSAFVVTFLLISLIFKNCKKTAICLLISLIPLCCWTLWCLSHNPLPRNYAPSHYLGILAEPADITGISKAIDVLSDTSREAKQDLQTLPSLQIDAPYIIASIPLWLLILTGTYSLLRYNFHKGLLIAGPFFSITILLIAGSMMGKGNFTTRYLVFQAIPMTMLICSGAHEIKGKLQKAASLIIPLTIGFNLLLCAMFPFTPELWNQYWQSTIDFIESHKTEGDAICLYHPLTIMQFGLAYDPQSMSRCDFSSGVFSFNRTQSPGKLEIFPLDIRSASNKDLINYLSHRNVFLILHCANKNEEYSQIMDALDSAFTPKLKFHSKSYIYSANVDCYLLVPKKVNSIR